MYLCTRTMSLACKIGRYKGQESNMSFSVSQILQMHPYYGVRIPFLVAPHDDVKLLA